MKIMPEDDSGWYQVRAGRRHISVSQPQVSPRKSVKEMLERADTPVKRRKLLIGGK
jgi:hypothetical protein